MGDDQSWNLSDKGYHRPPGSDTELRKFYAFESESQSFILYYLLILIHFAYFPLCDLWLAMTTPPPLRWVALGDHHRSPEARVQGGGRGGQTSGGLPRDHHRAGGTVVHPQEADGRIWTVCDLARTDFLAIGKATQNWLAKSNPQFWLVKSWSSKFLWAVSRRSSRFPCGTPTRPSSAWSTSPTLVRASSSRTPSLAALCPRSTSQQWWRAPRATGFHCGLFFLGRSIQRWTWIPLHNSSS